MLGGRIFHILTFISTNITKPIRKLHKQLNPTKVKYNVLMWHWHLTWNKQTTPTPTQAPTNKRLKPWTWWAPQKGEWAKCSITVGPTNANPIAQCKGYSVHRRKVGNSVVSFSNVINLVRIWIESLSLFFFFIQSCVLGPQGMQCAIQLANQLSFPALRFLVAHRVLALDPTTPGTFSKCCGLVTGGCGSSFLYNSVFGSTSGQVLVNIIASWHPRVEIRMADLRESSWYDRTGRSSRIRTAKRRRSCWYHFRRHFALRSKWKFWACL